MFIADSSSKFGTFVKVKGMLPLSCKENDFVPIQIERKCLFFSVRDIFKQTFCSYLCPNLKKSTKVIGAQFEDNFEKYPVKVVKSLDPETYKRIQHFRNVIERL